MPQESDEKIVKFFEEVSNMDSEALMSDSDQNSIIIESTLEDDVTLTSESETSRMEKITDRELILINQESHKDETSAYLHISSKRYGKTMKFLHSKYKTEQLLQVNREIVKNDPKVSSQALEKKK